MRRLHVIFVLGALVAVGACGGVGADRPEIGAPDTRDDGPIAGSSRATIDGQLLVVGASSLTGAFTEIVHQFEDANPEIDVLTSFTSSAAIVAQVDAGLEADVIATADERTMARIRELGATSEPLVFAQNELEIAVERENPEGVMSLEDLARRSLTVVACEPDAPCGALSDLVLADAGLSVDFASREPNVRAAAQRVAIGEADAALVYATDVAVLDVDGVAVESERRNLYPIAVAPGASNPTAAQTFIDFVIAESGQQTLASWGFLAP